MPCHRMVTVAAVYRTDQFQAVVRHIQFRGRKVGTQTVHLEMNRAPLDGAMAHADEARGDGSKVDDLEFVAGKRRERIKCAGSGSFWNLVAG